MEISFKVEKSANYILDYLTDIQKFVSVHPVITKIDKQKDGSYLVFETLKLGFVPFSFTYPATIEREANTVIICARVMKLVKMEMKFLVTKENDFSIVQENTTFKSVLPVSLFMPSVFRKQHKILFKNIENSN